MISTFSSNSNTPITSKITPKNNIISDISSKIENQKTEGTQQDLKNPTANQKNLSPSETTSSIPEKLLPPQMQEFIGQLAEKMSVKQLGETNV